MGIYSDVLLTVDYDRTLTAPDSTIPRRNLDAIEYFMAEGGAFTVNTGRSVPMFRPVMDKVPVNAPLLLYNGSAAYDKQTGQLSFASPIEMDLWETVEIAIAAFPDLTVEVQGLDYHYCFSENKPWEAFSRHNGCACARAYPGDDLGPFLKFSLYGQIRSNTVADMYNGSPEELARLDRAEQELKALFPGKVEVFRATPRIIDIHARGVSKARAARRLKEELGRKILVCVGDAHNDIPMLEGADYAYCPADAVIKGQFEGVCPCGEGAVADVILKKIPEILGNDLDNI